MKIRKWKIYKVILQIYYKQTTNLWILMINIKGFFLVCVQWTFRVHRHRGLYNLLPQQSTVASTVCWHGACHCRCNVASTSSWKEKEILTNFLALLIFFKWLNAPTGNIVSVAIKGRFLPKCCNSSSWHRVRRPNILTT